MALSNCPESDIPSSINGLILSISSFQKDDEASTSLAFIHEKFDCIVFISPLWASIRKGCALSHVDDVFVENLWWKIPNLVL